MSRFRAILLVQWFLMMWWSAQSSETHLRTTIAMCRAMCVNEFFDFPLSDRGCRRVPNCFMCWETCEMLHDNFTVWGNMCGVPEICFPGCQKTCRFYYEGKEANNVIREIEDDESMPWSFVKSTVQFLRSEDDKWVLEWSRPQAVKMGRSSRDSSDEGIVYIVSVKKGNGPWKELKQTSQQHYYLPYPKLESTMSFRVIAVTEKDGQVAHTVVFAPADDDAMLGDDPTVLTNHKAVQIAPSGEAKNNRNTWTPTLVSLKLGSEPKVTAQIRWSEMSPGCKYEVSWRVSEYSFDGVGRKYVEGTETSITLLPGHSNSVKVKCYGKNGSILRASKELLISTKDVQDADVSPVRQSECADCWKWVAISCSVPTGVVLLFLVVGVVILTRLARKSRPALKEDDDLEKAHPV